VIVRKLSLSVVVLVLLAASLFVLGFFLVALGFQGESYKRGFSPLHALMSFAAFLSALVPLVVSLITFVKVWGASERRAASEILFRPVQALFLMPPVAMFFLILGEVLGGIL
jgi:hypothetical protein